MATAAIRSTASGPGGPRLRSSASSTVSADRPAAFRHAVENWEKTWIVSGYFGAPGRAPNRSRFAGYDRASDSGASPEPRPKPMRFTPQFLDELKARLPVSEVVGKRVALKKAGREWRGLSPFNKEKTPSFFVNDQKQAWFDFSSGKNGSIFDFIMETEGVTFPEAVERLAAMAGVAVPKSSPEDFAREEKRK